MRLRLSGKMKSQQEDKTSNDLKNNTRTNSFLIADEDGLIG